MLQFKKHAQSKYHTEAIEAVVTLPSTSKSLDEMLILEHKKAREEATEMLHLILSSVWFLARQGLALRGQNSDESSNLVQLLKLRAQDKSKMLKWLEKSSHKHVSPENQNEMLQLMANKVLRDILELVRSSPFITLMVDETTDKSNKEQLTIVMRWVSDKFEASEEFLGFHYMLSIDALSIVNAIKDIFLRFQIPFSKLRGQCYDGCSTMAGAKSGVATRIQEIQPRAVFTHCYGHALNLSVADTIKQSAAMKDCLDICSEVIKLLKFSPKREAMLKEYKNECGSESSGIRTLCPTRWTVRAESLASIIDNYENVQELWERAYGAGTNSEMKARIRGVESQMKTFKFFFSMVLSEMIFRHTDKLSQTLQQTNLSTVEGYAVAIAMLTVKTLQSLRTDENFELFWKKIDIKRQELDVAEPQLDRKRKVPKRFDHGSAQAEHPVSAKSEYRRIFLRV